MQPDDSVQTGQADIVPLDWGAEDPVARAAARHLHAMLRASDELLDLLPVATFVCDAHGVILQYNRRAVEIWGGTPKPSQTHAEFRADVRAFELDGTPSSGYMMAEVLATGTPVRDIERIVERVDGSRVTVSISIDPLRDPHGNLIGAVNCFYDITERKRVDEALVASRQHALEQEQRVAATYEHAAIGITELAPDGRILRVNEAISAISGFSAEELMAVNVFSNTHADDADADRENFRKQVAGERRGW